VTRCSSVSVGLCMLLGFSVATFAAEQPKFVARLDLTASIGVPGTYSSVSFLTDEVLVISNGQSSPASVLFHTTKNKILRTGNTCATTGRSVWASSAAGMLVACAKELVLYDQEFRPMAHIAAELKYVEQQTLKFSPTREYVAVEGAGKYSITVWSTDTLSQVASFPLGSKYITGIFKLGYLVYGIPKGAQGGGLTFFPFQASQGKTLLNDETNCGASFAIGESEVLATQCGKRPGEIIDVSTAQVRVQVPETKSATFAQTSISGKRFALGFQEHSRVHTLKQVLNPFTYIKALGTCCDDPSDLFTLKVYDQQSGRVLTEFQWKTNKNEPLWERYDNSAVALSPTGDYVAFLRGSVVEVYEISDKPMH
jgi:hypothetical protein